MSATRKHRPQVAAAIVLIALLAPDQRIRQRFAWEADKAWAAYAGQVWAARTRLGHDSQVAARMAAILHDVYRGVRLEGARGNPANWPGNRAAAPPKMPAP